MKMKQKYGGTANIKCGQGMHGHGYPKGPQGPTRGETKGTNFDKSLRKKRSA